jgi:hypothetical protein
MRHGTIAGLVVLAASLASAPAHAQNAYDLGDAKHLKVLYAGVPETPRAKAFVDFLKANFDSVGELDVTKLSKASAEPFDVVVCDGNRLYPMDPKKPSLNQAKCDLGADFTKPIVMIASMGGTVQNHTKIGWL